MGSINDEIQRVLNPIYGDKSTNHLMRLFRIDHGLLEENLWQAFLQDVDFTGSLQDKLYYLFSNFESIFNASTGLYLPGTSGNYVSTPDTADLDITGSICLIAHIQSTDYTPSARQSLIGKFISAGYLLTLENTGVLRGWFDSRSSLSDDPGFIDNNSYKIAVTYNSSTGLIRFWSYVNSSWVQLGGDKTGTPTAITAGTDDLLVGANNSPGPGNFFSGTIYSAQVYDGIGDNSAPGLGTLVAEFDASAPVGPRYRDRTGKIWTINGSAWSWV